MKFPLIPRSVIILCLLTASTTFAQTLSGAISGTVFCSDTGKPAHFAVVRLYKAQEAALGEGTSARAAVNLNGSFTLRAVPPGDYYIDVTMLGYLHPLQQLMGATALGLSDQDKKSLYDMQTQVSVASGQTTDVKVTAYRGAVISGDAEYDDGTPASEITISALEIGVDGKIISTDIHTETDDKGHFRLSGLNGGTFTLEAHGPEMPDVKALHVYLGNVFDQTAAEKVSVKRGEEVTGMDFVLPTIRPS